MEGSGLAASGREGTGAAEVAMSSPRPAGGVWGHRCLWKPPMKTDWLGNMVSPEEPVVTQPE